MCIWAHVPSTTVCISIKYREKHIKIGSGLRAFERLAVVSNIYARAYAADEWWCETHKKNTMQIFLYLFQYDMLAHNADCCSAFFSLYDYFLYFFSFCVFRFLQTLDIYLYMSEFTCRWLSGSGNHIRWFAFSWTKKAQCVWNAIEKCVFPDEFVGFGE